MAKQKSIPRKTKSDTRALKWIITIAVLLISVGLFYWINYADPKSGNASTNTTSTTVNDANLIRANQLTQEVFHYVEMVETKKLTLEEADRISEPIKVELQNVRTQLSHEQIEVNDSIRKALGDIMVSNVMKWRAENPSHSE